MKNYHLYLKRFIGVTTLSLLVSAGPLYAQSEQSSPQSPTIQKNVPDSSQPSYLPDRSAQSTDAAMSRELSRNSSTEMDQSMSGSGREINEPAGADNEKNWSWLGLLGLIGLFGLKRRHDVEDENYRPLRA